MELPWVSRDRYNELKAAHADLLEKYHALRTQGAVLPAQRRATVTPPPPSPEAMAAQRMHDALIDRMAEGLKGAAPAGISGDALRAEAERLKRAAFGEGLPT